MHNNTTVALKPNFMNSLLLYGVFFLKYEFSLITHRISNLANESPEIFVCVIFGLIFCLRHYILCLSRSRRHLR